MDTEKKPLAYRIATAVAALLGQNIETPQPEPRAAEGDDYLNTQLRSWQRLFGVEHARNLRYQDYEEMDYGPLAAQLDALVDAVTVSDDGRQHGFKVKAGAKYQGVIDRIVEQVDFKRQARIILRSLAKYGDLFAAPVFDNEYNIVSIEMPPVQSMIKNVDEFHRLRPDKDENGHPRAFQMLNEAGRIMVGWFPWEMRHLRWDGVKQEHLSRTIYSTASYFEALRKDWRKLQMIEEGMVIARLTRAYPRPVHYIDHTGKSSEERKAALKEYMQEYGQRKLADGSYVKHPLETDEDIFVSVGYREAPDRGLEPSLSKIDLLDPRNTGLGNINDVEYLRDKLFLRQSKEIIGIRGDREDVSQQDVFSGRLYVDCQRILTEDLIWPILRLGLLLKGYVAKRDEVEINWPDVAVSNSWRLADARFRLSLMYRTFLEASVIPREFVAKTAIKATDEEWQRWRDETIPNETRALGSLSKGDTSSQQAVGNLSTGLITHDELYETVARILFDLLSGQERQNG